MTSAADTTVRIQVQFSRLLKRRPKAVELPQGATVSDLLLELGFNELQRRSLRVGRGDEVLKRSAELFDDDEVMLFTMLAGG
jgi:sulfur carrier protein ThiS